jgi:DNA polymerase alpha subunit A
VTEEEYAALVNKRRQEYGGFIVGEDGEECVPCSPHPPSLLSL